MSDMSICSTRVLFNFYKFFIYLKDQNVISMSEYVSDTDVGNEYFRKNEKSQSVALSTREKKEDAKKALTDAKWSFKMKAAMYGIAYRESTLYMIDQKHSKLDLSSIPFDELEGYEPVLEGDREEEEVEKDYGIVGEEEAIEVEASLGAQELITQQDGCEYGAKIGNEGIETSNKPQGLEWEIPVPIVESDADSVAAIVA